MGYRLSAISFKRSSQASDGAGSTSYSYDKNGNRTRVQDANGNSTSFTFDELNRRTGISYPDGGSESFGYDGNGNLVSHKDGNGVIVSHAYDALNRETSKTYSASADGLSRISTGYDPNNNVTGVVQVMSSGNQSSSYSYDNFDRQQSHTDPFGAKAITSYDPNGNKTSLITQDGKVSRYSYDALNRLTNLTGQSGSISYSWDRSGLNTGMAYSNGVTSSTRFDAAKRTQSVLHTKGSTALSRTEYSYDSNSNRTRETINRVGGAQSTSYNYDAADRLTRTILTDPNQSVTTTYELDAVGNRSKETVNTQAGNAPATILSKTYRYDGRNQLTGITDSSAGDTALSYDNQGNLIRKTRGSDITHYTYNARDNLISVSKNATLLGAYTNDHLGLRVEKEAKDPQQPNAPPVKLRTLWDGRNAFQDSDTSGQVQTRYENNGRHPVAMWSKNDGSQALHQDALGSIVATTDSSGALKSETIYDAFGNITTQSGSSANKFGYTGHQMDNETGLIYFQARYYDPQLGRFITQDPFEGDWMTPMSLHHYLYAYGNPTTYIDLHGYSSTCFSDNPANCRSDAENAKLNQQRDQARQASIEDTSNSERYRKDHDSGENWKPGRKHTTVQEGGTADTEVVEINRDYEKSVRTPAKRAHRTGQCIADAGYDTVDTLRPTPATVLAGPGAKILAGAGAKLASKLATSSRAAVGRVEAKVAEATKAGQAEGRAAEKAEARSAEKAEARNAERAEEKGASRTECSCCFAAGTPVLTESGFKPIEDIRVGDLVASRNEQTGEQAFKPVTDLILTKHKPVYELILREQNGAIETLSVTDNHPFWVLNQSKTKGKRAGWVDSAKLTQGMRVQTHEGKTLTVLALVAKHIVQPTYNFTVADFHTYFVGNGKAWVHNQCPCALPVPGRNGALNQAKKDLGIPRAQHPESIKRVRMTDSNGNSILGANGQPIHTREYTYKREDGSKVVIQDHSAGHKFGEGGVGDQGAHFNVRPPSNTRTGKVEGTADHYSFKKK